MKLSAKQTSLYAFTVPLLEPCLHQVPLSCSLLDIQSRVKALVTEHVILRYTYFTP
jgi:hypothetical protein